MPTWSHCLPMFALPSDVNGRSTYLDHGQSQRQQPSLAMAQLRILSSAKEMLLKPAKTPCYIQNRCLTDFSMLHLHGMVKMGQEDSRRWARKTPSTQVVAWKVIAFARTFQAMVILLAPWSCVQLKLVKFGWAPEPQFGIFAKQDIPVRRGSTEVWSQHKPVSLRMSNGLSETIYELAGLLLCYSVDGNAKTKTTMLSEMYAPDGSTRVLFGPISFNSVFENLQNKDQAITVVTTKAIRAGEQIMVNYGQDYWLEGERCRCAICEPPILAAPRPSHIVDQEMRLLAKKGKNKCQKAKKKDKLRAAHIAQPGLGELMYN
ncbi:hypothetical protein B0H13DRAFT_1923112 [Mycena leptocephala]|nr:hypothetical protein B0H13DRAFT_1923112 [Mycena leptocephala]